MSLIMQILLYYRLIYPNLPILLLMQPFLLLKLPYNFNMKNFNHIVLKLMHLLYYFLIMNFHLLRQRMFQQLPFLYCSFIFTNLKLLHFLLFHLKFHIIQIIIIIIQNQYLVILKYFLYPSTIFYHYTIKTMQYIFMSFIF